MTRKERIGNFILGLQIIVTIAYVVASNLHISL